MTTSLDTTVIVGADGLTVVACAWCTPRARLEELSRTYIVSHSMCNNCSAKVEAGAKA